MVSEVPRCLAVKTAVHHDTYLLSTIAVHSCPILCKLYAYAYQILLLWHHVENPTPKINAYLAYLKNNHEKFHPDPI